MESLVDVYPHEEGYAKLPWGIDLLLTDACNLRCSYCPIWGENATVPVRPPHAWTPRPLCASSARSPISIP